jgi:hypothetical protein
MAISTTKPLTAAVLLTAAVAILPRLEAAPCAAGFTSRTVSLAGTLASGQHLGVPRFAPGIGRLLVPLPPSGDLALIDPAGGATVTIPGLSLATRTAGLGCVDAAGGRLHAIDAGANALVVLDPDEKRILAVKPLAGDSSCLLDLQAGGQIWVTQPQREQFEIFSAGSADLPSPVHLTFLPVPGGPGDAVEDAERHHVLVRLVQEPAVVEFDERSRLPLGRWELGCKGGTALALDATRQRVFAACGETGIAILDAAHPGTAPGHIAAAASELAIAGDHLYALDSTRGTLAIYRLTTIDRPALCSRRRVPHANSLASDGKGLVWIGDARRLQLLAAAAAAQAGSGR